MRNPKNLTDLIRRSGVSLVVSLAALTASADYSSTVASFNPVGYWRFDEATASPALKTIVNLGTLGSVANGYSVLDTTNGQPGIVGTCARFWNPAPVGWCGSKIDVPFNKSLNIDGSFSIECWVKPDRMSAFANGTCAVSSMMNDFGSANRSGYLIYVYNDGMIEFRLGNSGGYIGTINNATTPSLHASSGNWRHVVGTYDSTTRSNRLFIDGVLVAHVQLSVANAAALQKNSQMPFRIGGTPFNGTLIDVPWPSAIGTAGNRGWDGWIDEVAYYPYSLTGSQCAAHFAAASTNNAGYSAQIIADGPSGYWPLNDAVVTPPSVASLPMAANSGSAGSAGDATNRWGALANQPGAPFAGMGVGNKSVFLDGANGSVIVKADSASLSNVTGQITMMAWVKPTVKNGVRNIIAKGWDNSWRETFLRITRGYNNAGYGTTNRYEVGTTDGADDNYYDAATFVMPEGDVNNWVFLAGTYDGGTWRLYRNGQLVASLASANGPILHTNVGNWTIGSRFGPPSPTIIFAGATVNEVWQADGNFFGGNIDEPAIFNTALSGNDISNIYAAALVSPIVYKPIANPNGYAHSTWPQLFQGRSTTLTVGAEGVGTLSYQWYSNGVPVGANLPSLNLTSMVVGTPTYSVVVTNLYGAATSSVTLSIIHSAPTFTVQPVPLSRFAGTPFSFSATMSGSLPVGFVWKTNGVDIPGSFTTGTEVGNVTVASYSGTAVLGNSSGFSVTATNAAGTGSSATAALLVYPAPYQFSAAAMANSPIAYWRLGETNGSTIAYDYIGANNGTYFNATLNQPGYSGIDSNTAATFAGTANSYVGQINGTPGTGIDFEGTNSSFSIEVWAKGPAGQGDGISLVAKGTGDVGTTANEQFALDIAFGHYRFMTRGNNAVIYSAEATDGPNDTWQHVVGVYDQSNPADPQMRIYVNGVLQGSGPGRPADLGGIRASSALVSIGSKRLGNSPNYDGSFNGSIDEVSFYNTALSTSDVETHYAAAYGPSLPPSITVQPASVTNYAGLNATFSVAAIGTVPLTYQWKKDGVDISGANGTSYSLNGLIAGDAGSYSCGITNVNGGIVSAAATLTVLPAPTGPVAIPGLVMHHTFDNTLTDATGRGNNGVAINRVGFAASSNVVAATYTAGRLGSGALSYSSDFGAPALPGETTTTNTSYVSLGVRPDLQFSSNVNFSVAFWVKLAQGFTGGDLPFFTATPGSLGGQGYVFSPAYGYGNGSGADPTTDPLNYGGWGVSLYNSGAAAGARVYGELGGINDGEWHHLLYVFNRSQQVVVYQNGTNSKSYKISGTTTADANTIDTGQKATIGQDPTGLYAETGAGELDDLAVWTKALTPLEAASVYAAALAGFSPGYVPGPVILTQPNSILAVSGTATNLSVVASTSTGVTNYQWYRNGNLMAGQTSATLSFPSLAPANAGSYFVRVNDSGGFKDSSVVTVALASQPRITNSVSGTTFTLTFASQVGIQYVTEWKGALTNGVWNPLVTNGGTGSPISVPTSTTPDAQRFYRIRMQQ